ncbi:MAG: hypothetical protein U0L36_00990 [Acutalibacteraceae bacterium]|nr:hypothetical protein [Acutalibacteraceae bacterium]
MPYVKRITKAGKTVEVEYYYTSRYNKKGGSRSDKVKPTKEQQKKINTRQAERKLRLLINNNFGFGDYHVVLDYIREKGKPDRAKDEMKKDIQVFLRECRKLYKKQGLEFKYIHVMEIGKRGARHHHLVVNHIDVKVLQQAWYKAYEGHNRVKVFPLDDTGQYADLAAYFIKYSDAHLKDDKEERLQGKRWAASKNLVKPEPVYEIVTHRSWYRCEPKAKKGYYIDKKRTEKGITSPEYYGYGYFKYTMVQLE